MKIIKKENPVALILDTGRFLDGMTEADKTRSKLAFTAMAKMGYDAAGVSVNDFRFGQQYLLDLSKETKLPLLSCNITVEQTKKFLFEPYLIKKVGALRVAIIAVSSQQDNAFPPPVPSAGNQPQAQPQPRPQPYAKEIEGLKFFPPMNAVRQTLKRVKGKADFIVLLSALSADETYEMAKAFPEINLILTDGSITPIIERTKKENPNAPYYSSMYAQVGNTYIYHGAMYPQGRLVAKLDLILSGQKIVNHKEQWVLLDDSIPDDSEVRSLLGDYYEQLAKDKPATPAMRRMAWEKLENDPNNGYVGSLNCRDCHLEAYTQWKRTQHSTAYATLISSRKNYLSDCISCHTTGFAYPTGFEIKRMERELQGVGCESCHGPGKLHIAQPGKDNIRKVVTKQHCLSCHTPDQSPKFEELYDQKYPMINHKQPSTPTAPAAPPTASTQNRGGQAPAQ